MKTTLVSLSHRPDRPRLLAILPVAAAALMFLSPLGERPGQLAYAAEPPPTAPATGQMPGAAALIVTARLVEIPTKFPPDDLYDYAYVMRYQVQGGPLDNQFILVAHYKPRQPRAKINDTMKPHVAGKLRSFKTGDVHKLQLSPALKSIWKGALLDEYAATDRKSTRYWALSADPV